MGNMPLWMKNPIDKLPVIAGNFVLKPEISAIFDQIAVERHGTSPKNILRFQQISSSYVQQSFYSMFEVGSLGVCQRQIIYFRVGGRILKR